MNSTPKHQSCAGCALAHVQNGSVHMNGVVRKDLAGGTLVAFHDHNRSLEYKNLGWNQYQHFETVAQHHRYSVVVAGIPGLSSDTFSPSPCC